MMQPETWKAIGAAVQTLWNVAGPVVGLYIGARLTRSSDRKKWLNDNRAAECREILKAMATTIHLMFTAQTHYERNLILPEDEKKVNDSYNECVAIMQYRIFIAKDVKKHQLEKRWIKIIREYSAKREYKEAQQAYDELQEIVVKMALEDSPEN
jgi:hypothetical protein